MQDIGKLLLMAIAMLLLAILIALLGSTVVLAMQLASVTPLALPRVAVQVRQWRIYLTQASKMLPVYSFSLPARQTCPNVKTLIRKLGERSVCAVCYAWKRGNYRFRNVQKAQSKRLNMMREVLRDKDLRADAVTAFAQAIRRAARIPAEPGWRNLFRWHDSGDIYSAAYARFIRDVARATPGVRHWVPCRQWSRTPRKLQRALRQLAQEPNVELKLSGLTINGTESQAIAKRWNCSATYVASSLAMAREMRRKTRAKICPATVSHSSCYASGCRACYGRQDVIYLEH